jgi:hypothetical protein
MHDQAKVATAVITASHAFSPSARFSVANLCTDSGGECSLKAAASNFPREPQHEKSQCHKHRLSERQANQNYECRETHDHAPQRVVIS